MRLDASGACADAACSDDVDPSASANGGFRGPPADVVVIVVARFFLRRGPRI